MTFFGFESRGHVALNLLVRTDEAIEKSCNLLRCMSLHMAHRVSAATSAMTVAIGGQADED